ncbi:MAG: bifunctional (p)ppGpp synthetase/guanosine-3',5'-bis(diphosphate) 3'-pyrophosphohydrolase [Ruminococcaceae bacterium]|nr:bifunctional (p)ppGpp synthetase/guanosine-3',5'-bis(diphosphate) 3'-pyrophosphohydrolase [Oscillospiraceae bacterium]
MNNGIEKLLFILEKSGKNYDLLKIRQAYRMAAELHEGQFRNSGEAYISHPIAVAEIAAGLGLDTDSICAALLHDTVEDCAEKIDLDEIKRRFGPVVAELVDGLTKMVNIPFADKEEQSVENLRKMLLAMSRDIRVIFIKLCDRLHNMRTLDAKPEHKRRITALETMNVYAPLAHRLGMQRIKHELENLSLSYLDPIGYNEVYNDIERKYGINRNFLEKARGQIADKLTEYNIHFQLEGRVKSVYSIYKKMYNQNKSFDEIYDFYALRIIVDTELECYTALGIIHDMFRSMPGRFKDYISTPKPNLYRSLHTTVIGRDGIPFEVQIRTWDMHHIAEYGIAAHWKYKSGEESGGDIDKKLEWVANLVETEEDTHDPDEFMRALKIDIFQDETFVFTPKGDVIALPQGSTVIDFAYNIHSQVGNKMIGGKINGMIVPIDRVLQNGEIVEIITSGQSRGPSRDWLKIVKTSEAKNKIRQWFKKEKRTENIAVGRAELDRELKHYGVAYTEAQYNTIMANLAKRLGLHEVEDLYNTIGYGGMSVAKISGKLRDAFDAVVTPEPPQEPLRDVSQVQLAPKVHHAKHFTGSVIVDGVDGCQVKFAKCCNPLPGDKLIAFVTKGFGISVHKADCINIAQKRAAGEDETRFKEAQWVDEYVSGQQNRTFEAVLHITAVNSYVLIAEITMALADMRVSILQMNSQNKNDSEVNITMTVGCKNLEHLYSIQARLRSIRDVLRVTRS